MKMDTGSLPPPPPGLPLPSRGAAVASPIIKAMATTTHTDNFSINSLSLFVPAEKVAIKASVFCDLVRNRGIKGAGGL
jgi:hypothetical protein